jgi:DNA-binding LacI/PurR family transcriptional regulator
MTDVQNDRKLPVRASVMMDVARLAGVSHQTVSRVLNDHANVRPQTRERVLEAMRELDYQPNSAARTLVTRRSNTLGIVTVDSTLFGPASMLYGIEQAARSAGYFVSIASISSLSQRTVTEAVNRLREQAVEGIFVILPKDSGVAALATVSTGFLAVAVGVGDGAEVPVVCVDNIAGAILATAHLLEHGHRTVHHISGPVGMPESRERRLGWRKALTAAGAAVPDVLVGDWSAKSGYELGQRLARDVGVTAVFCGNDQMALGLLRALSEVGRRVPKQVSVVGFDDIPEAPFMIPPLTTVKQDFAEVGRRSMQLFVELASGERPRGQIKIQLTPELIVRESTGPLRHGRNTSAVAPVQRGN